MNFWCKLLCIFDLGDFIVSCTLGSCNCSLRLLFFVVDVVYRRRHSCKTYIGLWVIDIIVDNSLGSWYKIMLPGLEIFVWLRCESCNRFA